MNKQNLYTEIVTDFHSTLDHEKKRTFNTSGNTVSSLFDSCLNRNYKNLVKIRVDLTNKKDFYLFSEPCQVSPICHIDRSFNFDNYFKQSKLERRKTILETLYASIKDMCEKLGYDLEPFTRAYEKVKELNYINKYIHGKLTLSRKRTHKAGIEIEVNEEAATIAVLFTDRNEKPIHKVVIMNTLPHYMFIYRAIHKGKWISAKEYQVWDRSKQILFTCNLESDTATVSFQPKTETEQELRAVLDELRV